MLPGPAATHPQKTDLLPSHLCCPSQPQWNAVYPILSDRDLCAAKNSDTNGFNLFSDVDPVSDDLFSEELVSWAVELFLDEPLLVSKELVLVTKELLPFVDEGPSSTNVPSSSGTI